MKAASLDSPRLQRFAAFVRAHPGASTREIATGAGVEAVAAVAAEMRHHLRKVGGDVVVEYAGTTPSGGRIYRYWIRDAQGPEPELRPAWGEDRQAALVVAT